MSKQIWGYFGLAIILLLTWLAADWLAPQAKKKDRPIAHRPDSFSTDISKISMNEDGSPKNKLVAKTMVHFNDDYTTELDQPVFTYFSVSSPPWIVKSRRGFIGSEGKTIFLGGDVHISRAAGPKSDPVTITTKNLTLKPKTNYAVTSEFAEMISKRNRISGVGLSLYFGDHKSIELHSKVRGKYDSR